MYVMHVLLVCHYYFIIIIVVQGDNFGQLLRIFCKVCKPQSPETDNRVYKVQKMHWIVDVFVS